jgi:RNA polymerase sigma factor (sigma-70 family)
MSTGGLVAAEIGESAKGDRADLENLYLRHFPDAKRLAYLMTGDRYMAEDLAQEAFARMVGRLVHLRQQEAFGAYLRQTVVNLCRMHFRRLRLERAYLRKQAETPPDHPAGGPDSDVLDELWTAIQRLPERQRMALVLRYYEDLREDQAAALLRCRPGTYRSLLARATATLRSQMRSPRDA